MNKIQKFFSVVFFIAIFVVLIYLIQNYGIEPLRSKIESMGIWAPFGIFILRGVSIILPALPSSAYSTGWFITRISKRLHDNNLC